MDPTISSKKQDLESPRLLNGDFDFTGGGGDRRYAFSRQASFRQAIEPHIPNDCSRPFLSRTASSIDIPPPTVYSQDDGENLWREEAGFLAQGKGSVYKFSISLVVSSVFRILKSGNRLTKRLLMLIFLNVAYSSVELLIGLFSGRIGLVSDAFHLTFGCGILSFSLFAIVTSQKKPDRSYTYGYKRLEVLAAFTNALFLLFMCFSLAVEALHAFIQDESDHKHYLIVSAMTNLLVNIVGVWFFRNYTRINLVYRNAEDMNYHSVCLHVLADSIRSAGLILASWLLSLGVRNAEALCLGLVSVTVFMLVLPLFKATGGTLLQMAPSGIPPSALNKCYRQVISRDDVSEVSQPRFWELIPGYVVGSLTIQVKEGMDDRLVLQYVHEMYHDLGVQELTVQTNCTINPHSLH